MICNKCNINHESGFKGLCIKCYRKEYNNKPENKIKALLYSREYDNKPENKIKLKIRSNKPENKIKKRERDNRLENKIKRSISQKSRYYEPEVKQKYKERRARPEIKIQMRNLQLKYKFNISKLDYDIKLSKQNNRCVICNREQSIFKRAFAVDHSHKDNKVRDLLCHNCNLILGNSREDIQVLYKVIEYIKRWELNDKEDLKCIMDI